MARHHGKGKYNTGCGVRRVQDLASVSNEEIAKRLGVSRMQVHRYRNNEDMRFSTMCDIAEICQMDIFDFINQCEE